MFFSSTRPRWRLLRRRVSATLLALLVVLGARATPVGASATSLLELPEGLEPRHAPAASWASWFDQVAPEAVFVLDESGGFAEIDPLWVSLIGDSHLWTRWLLSGVDVTDLWDPGTPAVRLPTFLAAAPERRDATLGGPAVSIGLRTPPGHRAAASWQHGRAGDLWPPAHQIMRALSGAHPRDRSLRPTSQRPHLLDPLHISATGLADDDGGLVFVDAWGGKRRFPVFSPVTQDTVATPLFAGTRDETFASVQAGWLRPRRAQGVVADVRVRSDEGLELWRAPEQSFRRRSVALAGWAPLRNGQLGAVMQVLSRRSPLTDYTVDLHDPDGQQTEPWRTPAGSLTALRLHGNRDEDHLRAEVAVDLVAFRPQAALRVHQLQFEGEHYGRAEVLSRSRWLSRPRIEAVWRRAFAPGRLTGAVEAGGVAAAMVQSGGNAVALGDLQARVHLSWGRQRRIEPFFGLSKVAVTPDPLLQQRITPGLADVRIWRSTATGEVLERTTGGKYIQTPRISDLPDIYATALGFALPVRDWWRLRVVGTAKLYTDLWRLDFAGAAEEYGYTVSDVYFYRDGPTYYRLVHNRTEPGVHYGLHLQWLGERPNVFRFAWTFSAYNVIGRPVPGNGPLANDLAVVDESGANPNSRIHGLANLDVDRAFNTKIAAGVKIGRPFWLDLFVTHYDGTPFTFYYAHRHDGQVAWVADQHRGSPFTFVGPLIGAREDFRLNLDARIQASTALRRVGLRFWFSVYNLFDFSNELVEMQSRAGREGRLTLVQEIPRAVEFGMEVAPR